jgi:hypothetical protein
MAIGDLIARRLRVDGFDVNPHPSGFVACRRETLVMGLQSGEWLIYDNDLARFVADGRGFARLFRSLEPEAVS